MANKIAAALVAGMTLAALPAIAQTTKPDFITKQDQSEWRASKLVGVNVYGTDNQKIGDISDVLVDKDGNAKAVVIGVGGFLGIGTKDVAVPFKSLQWQEEGRSTSGSSTTGTGTSTGMSGSSTSSADRGYPDHAVLAMSKQDLQSAPDFKYASETSSKSSTQKAPPPPASNPNPSAPK